MIDPTLKRLVTFKDASSRIISYVVVIEKGDRQGRRRLELANRTFGDGLVLDAEQVASAKIVRGSFAKVRLLHYWN